MIAKHLIITGHVQGVFYRATAEQVALKIGLRGWIQNNASGSVEAHIEGEDAVIEQFIDWCHHGPDKAEVENVQVTDCEPENCSSFEVRK